MKTKVAMYRRIVSIGCMVLVAGVSGAQEPVPEAPAKRPAAVNKPAGRLPVLPNKVARSSGKIFIQENSWDFGHVPQGVQVAHRFTVENVGEDTLYLVRIKPT